MQGLVVACGFTQKTKLLFLDILVTFYLGVHAPFLGLVPGCGFLEGGDISGTCISEFRHSWYCCFGTPAQAQAWGSPECLREPKSTPEVIATVTQGGQSPQAPETKTPLPITHDDPGIKEAHLRAGR